VGGGTAYPVGGQESLAARPQSSPVHARTPALQEEKEPVQAVELVFSIALIIFSAMMVLLVLLHKGKGGGLSDLFGGGMSSSLGGSSVVEKNLDRLTIIFGILWFVTIVVLGLLLKE
jgi:preprotein translocase subunit SecG